MGRLPFNRGLDRLCKARAASDRDIFEVADVVSLCNCHRRSLHLYTTGRKACPRLEAKIAAVFHLTVPQLRRRLGLPAARKEGRTR